MKTVAILQSNYLPWKGYFDIINDVDTFLFYDDVQYTKNDWRNRNLLKTSGGCTWITIPTGQQDGKLIHEVEIRDERWREKHWRTLQMAYGRAPYFRDFAPKFEDVFAREWRNLSELNHFTIKMIASELLGISTTFEDSRSYSIDGAKEERLLNLIKSCGATRYISGPAARSYINPLSFEEAGIELVFKNYMGYPEYPQFFGPFTHEVSIVDLLFQVGPDAPYYIWGWREGGTAPQALRRS